MTLPGVHVVHTEELHRLAEDKNMARNRKNCPACKGKGLIGNSFPLVAPYVCGKCKGTGKV